MSKVRHRPYTDFRSRIISHLYETAATMQKQEPVARGIHDGDRELEAALERSIELAAASNLNEDLEDDFGEAVWTLIDLIEDRVGHPVPFDDDWPRYLTERQRARM